MISLLIVTCAPILVAFGGDKCLDKATSYVLKSIIDNFTHGLVGLLSWVIVIAKNTSNRGGSISNNFEIIICGLIASLIDIDHFFAARSFSLRDALNLGMRRPLLHSSSLLFAVVFLMLAIGKVLMVKDTLFRLGMLLLVAGGSHHIRDGVRRGLWFPPWGSTPPLPQPVYLCSIGLLPHLVAVFIPVYSRLAAPIAIV